MEYSKIKNRIKNSLNRNISFNNGDCISNFSDVKRDKPSKGWVGVVAVDIVGYKKMITNSIENNIEVIKVIQTFTSELIRFAKSEYEDIYRSHTLAGDAIIFIFNACDKEYINDIVNFSFYLKSFGEVFNKMFYDNTKRIKNFKYGVGVHISNDNFLIKYGLGENDNSDVSIIGDSIYKACQLSKIANRGNYEGVIITEITKINLSGRVKNAVKNLMNYTNIRGIGPCYHGDVIIKDMVDYNW